MAFLIAGAVIIGMFVYGATVGTIKLLKHSDIDPPHRA